VAAMSDRIRKYLDSLTDCQVRDLAYDMACALVDVHDLHCDEADIDEDGGPNRSMRTVQALRVIDRLPTP
jgi:hypothetical protein